MEKSVATDLVIFGASGDLAKRKIIPALESLNGNNTLAGTVTANVGGGVYQIVGTAK